MEKRKRRVDPQREVLAGVLQIAQLRVRCYQRHKVADSTRLGFPCRPGCVDEGHQISDRALRWREARRRVLLEVFCREEFCWLARDVVERRDVERHVRHVRAHELRQVWRRDNSLGVGHVQTVQKSVI